MKREVYLVMKKLINNEEEPNTLETINSAFVVCKTFYMAYRVSMTIAKIARPAQSYRKSLEFIKVKKYCQISDLISKNEAIIIKVKFY